MHTIVSQLVLHRIEAIYFKKVSIFLSIQGPLGKMGKEGRKGGIGPKGTPGEVGAAGLRGPKVQLSTQLDLSTSSYNGAFCS